MSYPHDKALYNLSKPKLFSFKESAQDDSGSEHASDDGDDFQRLPTSPLHTFDDAKELPPNPSMPPLPVMSKGDKSFPAPPEISPGFQIHARRKILAALEKFEANRIAELDQGAHVTSSSKMNPLEFRAKYIRSTTPADEGGSTRIAKHAVPLLHPPAYKSSLPSITGTTDLTSTSVPLFSPRSFDRPARTPFIAPPDPKPARLSTPEFKAAVNFKLGPEAPLLWDTIRATKRQYPKEHGGAELRGQTRALAYRYMR